jgi:type III pantothenate kinase
MLLVDIGNSRIKWQRRENGSTQDGGRFGWRNQDVGALLDKQWGSFAAPAEIWVSNVAGSAVADQFSAWTANHWDRAPDFARVVEQACGVRNGYAIPAQLGVDRWLALIAAWRRGHCAACVADCGTAVTVDALSSNGEHLGGLILPGLQLMRHALLTNTHGIREDAMGEFVMFARNTQDGINAGGIHGIAALIERAAAVLKKQFGEVRCLLTGGDAEAVQSVLIDEFELIPNLVLDGLAVIAEGDE